MSGDPPPTSNDAVKIDLHSASVPELEKSNVGADAETASDSNPHPYLEKEKAESTLKEKDVGKVECGGMKEGSAGEEEQEEDPDLAKLDPEVRRKIKEQTGDGVTISKQDGGAKGRRRLEQRRMHASRE